MIKAQSDARGVLQGYRSAADLDAVNLKLGRAAAGFFDNPKPAQHSVIAAIRTRWGASSDLDALRMALLAGTLQHVLPEVESFVRYFDEARGMSRLEPLEAFLGLRSVDPRQHAFLPDGTRVAKVDELSRNFLQDCFGKGPDEHSVTDLMLPAWPGQHAENTKGAVRALAWLHEAPVIQVRRGIVPDDLEFRGLQGQTVRLVESAADTIRLAAERDKMKTGSGGTGVNEFAAFVWCGRSTAAIGDPAVSARELLSEIGPYDTELGKLELDMHVIDHVGLNLLAEKARARGVVGPLRLGGGALVVDPSSGGVIVQRKREAKRHYPLHAFGGSFVVADPRQQDSYVVADGTDIVRCARREVLEESNIALSMNSGRPFVDIPALLILQTDPAFLQLTFLGWPALPEELEHCFEFKDEDIGVSNAEGCAVRLPLIAAPDATRRLANSVAETFYEGPSTRRAWRPSGLLTLYAWHGLGCPGVSRNDFDRLNVELRRVSWPPSLRMRS